MGMHWARITLYIIQLPLLYTVAGEETGWAPPKDIQSLFELLKHEGLVKKRSQGLRRLLEKTLEAEKDGGTVG